MKTEVITIRIPTIYLQYFKEYCIDKTYESRKFVGYGELIREAIFEKYPPSGILGRDFKNAKESGLI